MTTPQTIEYQRGYLDGYKAGLAFCSRKINKYIKPGPLSGRGSDATAERNGMILAYNLIYEEIIDE